MSKNATDRLISSLSEELEPGKPLRHPFNRALGYIFVALIYVGTIAYFLGFRPDIALMFSKSSFLFEIVLVFAIFISAACAAAWMCVPDMRGQNWMIAIPLTLFGVFIVWIGLESFINDLTIPRIHLHHCAMDAALIAGVPVAAMVFLTTKGASTKPVLSSFMGMLSMGALGYFSLRFTCMSNELGHIAFYHVIPFVFGGALIGAIAQRFYRW